jgi:hypothetical protein
MYQFSRSSTGDVVIGSGTSTNTPPLANAGTDKTITLPTNSVQLTGTGSDPDGSIISYTWSKTGGPSQYLFSNSNSASTTVSNLIEGVHTFRLTVKDNSGATAFDDVIVTVYRTSNTGKEIRVNIYGGSSAYNSSQWNNWNTYSSLSSPTLKYSDGTASSIKTTLSAQKAISDNGLKYSTNLAPNEVIRYASYATAPRTLTISGLVNNKTYVLELYASRSGQTNNITRFTIGSKYVDIKSGNNYTNKASFTVTPINGIITIELRNIYSYNYINGFLLKE